MADYYFRVDMSQEDYSTVLVAMMETIDLYRSRALHDPKFYNHRIESMERAYKYVDGQYTILYKES